MEVPRFHSMQIARPNTKLECPNGAYVHVRNEHTVKWYKRSEGKFFAVIVMQSYLLALT